MEEKAKRDAQKRQVIIVAILNSKRPSVADSLSLQRQLEMQQQEDETARKIAAEENARLAAQIREEHERRAALIREAHEAERIQRQREEESTSRGGRKGRAALGRLEIKDGQREVRFDAGDPVVLPGFAGTWPVWRAYGPPSRQDPLYTTYDVEGHQEVSSEGTSSEGQQPKGSLMNRRTSPGDESPVCSLIVIEFAQAYYDTPPGRKKVEGLLAEIQRVASVRHHNLIPIYASKASCTERPFDPLSRLIVLSIVVITLYREIGHHTMQKEYMFLRKDTQHKGHYLHG